MDIFKWNTTQECEIMMSEKNTRQDATDELAIYDLCSGILK